MVDTPILATAALYAVTTSWIALTVAWPRRTRSFLVALDRERTDTDLAWERGVIALTVSLGVISVLGLWLQGNPGWLALAPLSTVALLAGVARAVVSRGASARAVPSRFSVPVEGGPSYGELISKVWFSAHLLVVIASLIAAWVSIEVGDASRLFLMTPYLFGLQLFIGWGFTRERLALAPHAREAHLDLLVRRRRASIRLIETLLTMTSIGLTFLALAELLPEEGAGGLEPQKAVLLGLTCLGAGTISALALWLPRIMQVSDEIRALAGTEVLGTHPGGWRWGGLIYWAPDDPSLFVPKQVGMGQTLNFAHPQAWLLLGLIILVPLALTFVLPR